MTAMPASGPIYARRLARRRQWLIEKELAEAEQNRVVYRAHLLALLRRGESTRVGTLLSDELGLRYVATMPEQRLEGFCRWHVDLASGRFAVIEQNRELTLVLWRPVLERNLGKHVAGMARGGQFLGAGRRRSGPTIS
jgi:Protein of unknown function (DUF3363)